jgi:hypothetical protein
LTCFAPLFGYKNPDGQMLPGLPRPGRFRAVDAATGCRMARRRNAMLHDEPMLFAETGTETPATHPLRQRAVMVTLCVLVAVAAGLLLWNFPHRYEVRDVDEIGYLQCGLELLEGLTPSYSRTPAGPFVWLSWGWGAGLTAQYLLSPSAEELQAPAKLRPYVAINHALFDTYRDLSGLRLFVLTLMLIAFLAAVVGGFMLGIRLAGLAGGMLVGGMMAFLPLFVDLAATARPYVLGWSFGMLAICAAALMRPKRWCFWTALFIGLAISSRLEWMALLPLLWWILWMRLGTGRAVAAAVRITLLAMVVVVVTSPWLVTNLVGNIRQVSMVRLIGTYAARPWQDMLRDCFGSQGLIPIILLWLAGIGMARRGERWQHFLLAGYVLVLLVSVCMGGNPLLRYQTSVIVMLLVAAACSLRLICRRHARLGAAAVAICLLLPLAQTLRLVAENRSAYVPDGSTEWIERHVPPGTRLYLPMDTSLRDPLPTAEAADYLWNEVTSREAWEQKWQYGLRRYGLTYGEPMRALSDEGMISERGNRRGWFILGGRPQAPEPRYDIRFLSGFTIYGARDIAAELAKTGGVVLWREPWPCRGLGAPVAQWTDRQGRGTYVYASPDVKVKLRE